MAITALPTPPSRTRPDTFSAEGDAFLAALPTFGTEANALAATVNSDAASAALSDTSAQAQVTLAEAQVALAEAQVALAEAAVVAAASAAGIDVWVSGTNYSLYTVVISPLNFQSYRCRVAGVSSTDPSQDSVNWKIITFNGQVPMAAILKYQW